MFRVHMCQKLTSSPFRPVAGTSRSQKSWSRRYQNDSSRSNQNDPEKNTERLYLSIRKTRISCVINMWLWCLGKECLSADQTVVGEVQQHCGSLKCGGRLSFQLLEGSAPQSQEVFSL